MSQDLTQPPCSYCGAPTEPVRQKKLQSTKYFHCCEPCESKHKIMLTYEDRLLTIKDVDTLNFLKQNLKSGVDMLYTSECMKSQECVLIFTNSTDSFKLEGSCKQEYINTLQLRGKEILKEVESHLGSGKIRITKEK